jgi:hypothetical protein
VISSWKVGSIHFCSGPLPAYTHIKRRVN